ncbi:hypothetical protein HPB47_026832 [Ixodes persulcatus]|uniref:Uncharacterized protein n=1 Tax=Ixodes persulcatus TaxID=34615 RepID=A0AC60PXY4_IXOPE|nr:hypothetical protein HPB47_026832 [Ixodes persulcatus]
MSSDTIVVTWRRRKHMTEKDKPKVVVIGRLGPLKEFPLDRVEACVGGLANFTIVRSCAPTTLVETLYADNVPKLTANFTPRTLVIVQRFLFYKRSQKPGKTFADICDFDETLSDMLRNRLMCGVRDEGRRYHGDALTGTATMTLQTVVSATRSAISASRRDTSSEPAIRRKRQGAKPSAAITAQEGQVLTNRDAPGCPDVTTSRSPRFPELQRGEPSSCTPAAHIEDEAAPIVPILKRNTKMRISGDYKGTINPVVNGRLIKGRQFGSIPWPRGYHSKHRPVIARHCASSPVTDTNISLPTAEYIYKRSQHTGPDHSSTAVRIGGKTNRLYFRSRRLSEKIEEREQYQWSNNLEIKGAPEEGDAYDIV